MAHKTMSAEMDAWLEEQYKRQEQQKPKSPKPDDEFADLQREYGVFEHFLQKNPQHARELAWLLPKLRKVKIGHSGFAKSFIGNLPDRIESLSFKQAHWAINLGFTFRRQIFNAPQHVVANWDSETYTKALTFYASLGAQKKPAETQQVSPPVAFFGVARRRIICE